MVETPAEGEITALPPPLPDTQNTMFKQLRSVVGGGGGGITVLHRYYTTPLHAHNTGLKRHLTPC